MNVFMCFKENVRFPKSPIACVSDGEIGVINAMTCVPAPVDGRCLKHVLNDIQSWLTEHGFSKAEVNVYKEHLPYILTRNSMQGSLDIIKELEVA